MRPEKFVILDLEIPEKIYVWAEFCWISIKESFSFFTGSEHLLKKKERTYSVLRFLHLVTHGLDFPFSSFIIHHSLSLPLSIIFPLCVRLWLLRCVCLPYVTSDEGAYEPPFTSQELTEHKHIWNRDGINKNSSMVRMLQPCRAIMRNPSKRKNIRTHCLSDQTSRA